MSTQLRLQSPAPNHDLVPASYIHMIILFQDPMGHKPTETPNAPFFPFLLLPSVSEMEKHASLFLGQSKGLQRNAPPPFHSRYLAWTWGHHWYHLAKLACSDNLLVIGRHWQIISPLHSRHTQSGLACCCWMPDTFQLWLEIGSNLENYSTTAGVWREQLKPPPRLLLLSFPGALKGFQAQLDGLQSAQGRAERQRRQD